MKAWYRGPLYVITDPVLTPPLHLVDRVGAALRGGADLVQLRHKGADPDQLIAEGRALLALCRRFGVPLIVNDHPDIARAIGADGVHVGRDDPPVAEARRILGPEAIIGASAYGSVDLAVELERQGASYVAFGAVFPSPTKPEEPVVPLSVFREARKRVSVPIVAIGGITLDNLEILYREARPDLFAVVSAVFGAPDPEAAARRLKERWRELEARYGPQG